MILKRKPVQTCDIDRHKIDTYRYQNNKAIPTYRYKKVSRTGRIDEKVGKCRKIFPNGVFYKKKK